VTWQVNKITGGDSMIGTITTAGLYTAPAQLPKPATVVVDAVSVSDPLAVGNLPITISTIPVTVVQVSPSKVSIPVSQSPPDFTATVLGSTDTTVTWDVNGLEGGDLNSVGQITWGQPTGCVTEGQYLAPPTVPDPPLPNPVPVTAIAADGTTSAPIMVRITSGQQYAINLSPSGEVFVMVGQTQPYNANEDSDPNDSVTWSVSGQGCTGVACGTITPTISHPPQPYLATYTAPPNTPNPPTVTVTVSSVNHPGVNATDEVFIQGTANPSISIAPTFQSVVAGQNQIPFQATIQNYDPSATVTWSMGCISDWDGGPGEDCNDNDRDGDGPGCMQIPGGRQHCGVSQPLDAAGNVPLTYISPRSLFTTKFQANQCSGKIDDGNGYVELTVMLQAEGCPGNPPTCTANACVQVQP
jgi:hypothetical protein